MTLHTGLFMLEGGWESGKVRCMEDDGKGKEKKKKRGFLPFSYSYHPPVLAIFFIITIFIKMPTRSLWRREQSFYHSNLHFYPYIIIQIKF